MKAFSWILLSFFTILKLQAQDVQVTLVDPCSTIEKKSTIIINDNHIDNASTPTTTATEINTVNFTLTTSVNTSAGVYNASGNLVRTLWSGVRYDAGNYKAVWSGIMDDGTQAPAGTYQVKVLTNNVKYIWEGVIGNTATSFTLNYFLNYGGFNCFAFAGTRGFYGHFFYEGGTTDKYFNTSDIGKTYDINAGVHAITTDCATDGKIIVWACADQYQNSGIDANQSDYIFATKVSDNSPVPFTNQTTHPSGRENETFGHFIGWFADTKSVSYSGIAIDSNFIFATIAAKNQLLVFNKTTGSIVQTLTFNNPGKLRAGSNNELWMNVNGTVNKYAVNNSTGALTPLNISLAATTPGGIAISPDNSTVLITDAGTQQVKAFSNSTGTVQWTLGQQGGYDTNGPAVTNTKFMFDKTNFSSPYVAYQPDSSFWVNDVGNYRALHFNSDRSYKEKIMYMPSSRSTNADPNKVTSIFCDELEFQRDYSKPLDNGVNGSWKLLNNWKVGTNLDIFGRFVQVVTLNNGHTYGSSGGQLYDLLPTGAVNVGGFPRVEPNHIEADGSFLVRLNYGNDHLEVRRYPLTGFTTLASGAQKPNWGQDQLIVTTPSFASTLPLWYADNTIGSSTNSNRYIFFNPIHNKNIGGPELGIGYHLGSIKTGSSTFEWQASNSTFYDYSGDYPRNGDFDIGNNTYGEQHSENCKAWVNGSNIFWNVNGEFWKANTQGGGEINIWNHFNEDGLLIGNFGRTSTDAALRGNTEFAGNAYSTALVKVANDFYIYHCDENSHAGVHSWHVTGLNTISEQAFPIIVSATTVPITDSPDLMVGLPYKSATFTGGNGFVVSSPAGLILKTNTLQYQKDSTDIALGGNANALILKSLQNTSNLDSWKLSAGISYQNSEISFGNTPDYPENFNYLEVIDQAGKIIVRFIGNQADTRNSYYLRVWFNRTIVAQGPSVKGLNFYLFRDIALSYTNGTLTFKHQDYPPVSINTPFESGANMAAPAYLRVNQQGDRSRYINLYKLRFVPGSVL